MNIAFIYPHWKIDLPPDDISDALAVIVHELSIRLAKSCKVTVYSRKKASKPKEEFYEGVHHKRIPMSIDYLLSVIKLLDKVGLRPPSRPFHSSALYYPNYALQVAKDLRKQKCDIAHVFTIPQYADIIKKLCPDIKVVLHMQDHSLTQRDRTLLEKQLQKVDAIIGCSRFVSQNIKEAFPLYSDSCYTIYNGVNIERFADKKGSGTKEIKESKRLLYVGRISPEKGVHVLIDAFKAVLADHPRSNLIIIGPNSVAPKQFIDPMKADALLEDLQKFYGVSRNYEQYLKKILPPGRTEKVSFLEKIPNFKLVSFYHDADLFVFPSVWHEPFGIPIIEAMAAGTPVISTRGGAFPEIVVDGKTGRLVDRGDAGALAQAISDLLSNDEMRIAMGSAGRKRVEALFSWEIISNNLIGLYEKVLSEN